MGGFSSDDPRKRGHAETQPSPFLQRAGRVEDRVELNRVRCPAGNGVLAGCPSLVEEP